MLATIQIIIILECVARANVNLNRRNTTMLHVEALFKRKEVIALLSSHKVAENQHSHTEDDRRTFTKHQTNKDKLLNTNPTVH